jgi:Gamma-glutamyl cyclotransferase, AIG2-like
MSSVWGFYYGGLINPEVMARLGMKPTQSAVATLPRYALQFAPLVNLVPSSADTVYGLLLELTHAEISAAYSQLKTTYLPQPVIAFDLDGRARAALCYVVSEMPEGVVEEAYVRTLLDPAETLGFPGWYLDKIRAFVPSRTVSS